MLKTIKQYIDNLNDITFDDYFTAYIMHIQDMNINAEMKYLSNRNVLNMRSMDRLIYKTMEGMNILDSCNKITEFI